MATGATQLQVKLLERFEAESMSIINVMMIMTAQTKLTHAPVIATFLGENDGMELFK